MMNDLETQMYMALNAAVMYLGDDFTMKELLTNATDMELQAVIFGWLAAKDMWDNELDVSSFIEQLRAEENE